MANDPCTVFEAINERRKEIFVGVTMLPMFETIQVIRRDRPAALAYWSLDDFSTFRSIEFNLDPTTALAFARRYSKEMLPKGWSYLFEPSLILGRASNV